MLSMKKERLLVRVDVREERHRCPGGEEEPSDRICILVPRWSDPQHFVHLTEYPAEPGSIARSDQVIALFAPRIANLQVGRGCRTRLRISSTTWSRGSLVSISQVAARRIDGSDEIGRG